MRDRLIYNSAAVYVGPTPATGNHRSSGASGSSLLVQVPRALSFDYSATVNRQNVNILGRLAEIGREIITPPEASFNFSYYDINAFTESGLGMTVDGSVSAFSGIINGVTDQKNYFVLLAPNEEDVIGNTSADNEFFVLGYGNGFINSYVARGAVGDLPQCTVGVEALNMRLDNNRTGIQIPAIDPVNGSGITTITCDVQIPTTGAGYSALRPGDILVSISSDGTGPTGVGLDFTDAKIQSYEFNAGLARTPLQKLGSKFPFARKINFPATVSSTITFDAGDYATGNLDALLCTDQTYTIEVKLQKPACVGAANSVAKIYQLKGAKFDGQNASLSIGPNHSVTVNFSSQVSSAESTDVGLFVSGIMS